MDQHKQHRTQGKAPEVRRPDEAIKDLEPEKEAGDAVKGGNAPIYMKWDA
jgi:hypothetical protein